MRRNTGSMIRTGTSPLTGISTAPNKDAAYLFGTKDQILSAHVGKISHRSLSCTLRMAKRVFSLTLKAEGTANTWQHFVTIILSRTLATCSLLGVERPEFVSGYVLRHHAFYCGTHVFRSTQLETRQYGHWLI